MVSSVFFKNIVDDVLPVKKIVIRRVANFTSRPTGNRNPVARDLKEVDIQIGQVKFSVFTSNSHLVNKQNRYVGEIQLWHDSSWKSRTEFQSLPMVEIRLGFPDLMYAPVYANGAILDKLQETQ